MVREFGSAKKAAEYAADLVYVLEGNAMSNAWSDKFYVVGKNRPRARFDNAERTQWVDVEWVQAKETGGGA